MTKIKYPRGSEWRKWDLHVHTPLSIEQHYWENNEDTWEKYIEDLEKLPPEFSVLWINDYLFLEWYENVLKEKKNGRLNNIDLILPVLEFRIEKFAWLEFKDTKRINLHVIFSNELSIEIIKSQFLNTLEKSYSLESSWKEWRRAITKESVEELWQEIKSKVPDGELYKYWSNLKEWFNNLNVSEDQIFESLKKDCFEGKYLIAIWKTEWDQLKWSDSSIATKKSIINKADIVFTSSETIENFNNAKNKLTEQSVKNLLLDCSDAHRFSNSKEKDRIWKCFTWIKADPTFEGLKQITYEPEERVFVWEKPKILERVKNNKTKYIKSIKINQIDWYDEKKWVWFKNQEIELNKELAVIIWNKWNWKSAIADMLWMLGKTTNYEYFSFLNKDRFHKNQLSKNFKWTIVWENDNEESLIFGDQIQQNSIEKVRYLPQNYFNNLTNELDTKKFTETLENVIFSHLEESKKLGKPTFSDLKNYKSNTTNSEIEEIKLRLRKINKKIVKLEKQKKPEELEKIKNKIIEKEEELKVQKDLLEDLKNPNEDTELWKEKQEKFEHINSLNNKIEKIDNEIEEVNNNISKLEIDKQNLQNFLWDLNSFKTKILDYKNKNREIYKDLWLNIDEIVGLKIQENKMTDKRESVEKEIIELKNKLTNKATLSWTQDPELKKKIENNSLIIEKERLLEEIEDIKKDLSKKEKEYQDYTEKVKKINNRIKEINGNKDNNDTLEYYKYTLKYISEKDESWKTNLQKELDSLVEGRLNLSLGIYKLKKEIIDLYKEFKKPIDDKVEENQEFLSEGSQININVKFFIKQDFNKNFLNFINQSKRWSFNWKIEWDQLLKEIYNYKDLNDEKIIVEILNNFVDYLLFDKRKDEKEPLERNIFEQVTDLEDFYNYIFSLDYIDTNFELKSWEKTLNELSPWEKWTLLLIFYLMIDEEWIPLVIDQPEDNLDNQSVFSMLSTFIRKAKKKRQIIIVTHNPNLAVWADAEQIIYTKIDKDKWNTFSFESWSIENPIINNHIVNILEWTMDAFIKRKLKYIE